jgi:hypothetical protein
LAVILAGACTTEQAPGPNPSNVPLVDLGGSSVVPDMPPTHIDPVTPADVGTLPVADLASGTPADLAMPIAHDLATQEVPHDLAHAVPHDLAPAVPHDLAQSVPHDLAQAVPHDLASAPVDTCATLPACTTGSRTFVLYTQDVQAVCTVHTACGPGGTGCKVGDQGIIALCTTSGPSNYCSTSTSYGVHTTYTNCH